MNVSEEFKKYLCPCVMTIIMHEYPNGIHRIGGHLLNDAYVKAYFMGCYYPNHIDKDGERICTKTN